VRKSLVLRGFRGIRRIVPWSRAGAAAALFCAWLLPIAAAGEGASSRAVVGQAFDREARSLSGIPVRLVQRTETQELPWKPVIVDQREVARALTDAGGFFSIDLSGVSLSGTLLMRCGDPARWDAVRYATPADRDVTSLVRRDAPTVINCVVDDAPGWAELVREIRRVGGLGTPKGKVLREHGRPPETVTLLDGVEEWRYPDARFRFHGAELVEGPVPPSTNP